MRALSEAVALALPGTEELSVTHDAWRQVRAGRRDLEVRIGVGPIRGDIPLRVLGHAAVVADSIRMELSAIAGDPDRIVIFSSAPKTGTSDVALALRSLAALAGALRIAGLTTPIVLDIASATREVSDALAIELPPALIDWLERAALRSGNEAKAFEYAIEHAAPSMFADLTDDDSVFRITVGSAPEARFWAARMHVRAAAIRQGLQVAPALGVIMRTLLVPWYHPTGAEPLLLQWKTSPATAVAALETAANPKALHGNAALKREARAARRFIERAEVAELVDAVSDPEAAFAFVRGRGFTLGPRLAMAWEVSHDA